MAAVWDEDFSVAEQLELDEDEEKMNQFLAQLDRGMHELAPGPDSLPDPILLRHLGNYMNIQLFLLGRDLLLQTKVESLTLYFMIQQPYLMDLLYLMELDLLLKTKVEFLTLYFMIQLLYFMIQMLNLMDLLYLMDLRSQTWASDPDQAVVNGAVLYYQNKNSRWHPRHPPTPLCRTGLRQCEIADVFGELLHLETDLKLHSLARVLEGKTRSVMVILVQLLQRVSLVRVTAQQLWRMVKWGTWTRPPLLQRVPTPWLGSGVTDNGSGVLERRQSYVLIEALEVNNVPSVSNSA
eukprot:s681_g8.t1